MKRNSNPIAPLGLYGMLSGRVPAGIALAGIALLTALAVCGTPRVARADVTNYSGTRRQIRACVLVSGASTDANGAPANWTPYVFYALENRTDYKLAGWEFVNPIAPTTISTAMYNRWQTRGGTSDPAFNPPNNTNTSPAYAIFKIGAALTKNIGGYWEVNLDNLDDTTLNQFDIVYMALDAGRTKGSGAIQFTATERERLRHYVDQGGTLWVENAGSGNIDNANGPFLFPLGGGSVTSEPQISVNPFHPLVTYPYIITATDVPNIGMYNGQGQTSFTAGSGSGPVFQRHLVPILQGNGATVSVLAGDYGSGHILLTANGLGRDLSGLIQGTDGASLSGNGVPVFSNDGAVSGTNFKAIPIPTVKFAFNVAAWLGSVPVGGANVRRTGGSQETIGYGIAPKWSGFPLAPNNPGSGAIIYKNVVFSVDGQNILRAYDIDPQESLGLNGLVADDGKQDFILGTPYDEIWEVPLGGNARWSTPAIFSLYDGKTTRDLLLISNDQGVTNLYDALPRMSNGQLASAPNLIGARSVGTGSNNSIKGTNGNSPLLPVPGSAYDDGVLFVPAYEAGGGLGNYGWHVLAVDLLSSVQQSTLVDAFGGNGKNGSLPSTSNWTPAVPALNDLVGSLSVGYVRDISTGALDEMVYVPVAGDNTTTPKTPVAPYLQALWFRTRNEPLSYVPAGTPAPYWAPGGGRAKVPWYTTQTAGSIDLRPVIHITHTNTVTGQLIGSPQDIYDGQSNGTYGTPVYSWVNGGMQITGLNVPQSTATDTYTVLADYALDWPGQAVGSGSTPLTGLDMAALFQNRRYNLYTNSNGGLNTAVPEFTGGVAIGAGDAVEFASSSGLDDQIMIPNNVMPDRIYSVTEQYGTNTGANSRLTGPIVNWMFSPLYSGSFDTWQIPPRLVNHDPFNGNVKNVLNAYVPAPSQASPKLPAGVSAFQVVGQPAVVNGVVYVVANAHFNSGFEGSSGKPTYNATVILALNETISGNITVNPPVQVSANGLQLQQPNFNAGTTAQYLTLRQATDRTPGGEFTADTQTDTNSGLTYVTNLHVLSMQSVGNNDTFNATLPFYLRDVTGAMHELKGSNGFGPLDNLLWFAVIPYSDSSNLLLSQPELQGVGGTASSGPTVSNGALYYNATLPATRAAGRGVTVSVDLTRISADANHYILNTDGSARVHVSNTLIDPTTGAGYLTTVPLINPPAASIGTVVAGTPGGVAALDNQATLIADADRLFEVDALGNALWSLSATTSNIQATSNGATVVAANSTAISRPSVVRHLSASLYLMADPENSRVVQVDRGGNVVEEIHNVNNGMNVLRPGDPISLNHPTDVDVITQQGTGISLNSPSGVTYNYAGNYLATHYFIADGGNFRALEVVDVVDPVALTPITMTGSDGSSVVMQQQVIFVTRSLAEQNQKYHYRTIQQFADPTTIPAGGDQTQAQQFMIASIDNVTPSAPPPVGNAQPTIVGAQGAEVGPGGGLMVIDRYGATDGQVANIFTSLVIPSANGSVGVRRQRISAPSFFREFDYIDPTVSLTTPLPRFLLCDANGCYVLVLRNVDAQGNITGNLPLNEVVVDWMLSDNDYYYLTGRHLRASSIQRLTQSEVYTDGNGQQHFAPHYLITNSYTGQDNVNEIFGSGLSLANVLDGDIHGEVFEIRGKDYYDNPITGAASTDPNDGSYNGYHYAGYGSPNLYQLYLVGQSTANGTNYNVLIPNLESSGIIPFTTVSNPVGPSIVRLVPNETLSTPPQTFANGTSAGLNANGAPIRVPIKRSIGSTDNATSSYLLQHPLFSERSN